MSPAATSSSTESEAAVRGRPRDPELDDVILVAAAALVDEGGLGALTMDGVARRAGVAKATIYRRYPSKVDLLAATCQAVTPTPPEPPDTGAVRDDLRAILGGVVASVDGPQRSRLVPAMIVAAADNAEVREALQRFTAGRRSRVATVVARGVERGELDPAVDAEVLGDQLVGAVLYRHLVSGRPLTARAIDAIVDQALRGVRPPR